MSPLRLLILIALAWLAWRLLSRILRPPTAQPRGGSARGDNRGGDKDFLPLTRCSVCGTYILQSGTGSATICERCRTR
jgi:hypothetical protein